MIAPRQPAPLQPPRKRAPATPRLPVRTAAPFRRAEDPIPLRFVKADPPPCAIYRSWLSHPYHGCACSLSRSGYSEAVLSGPSHVGIFPLSPRSSVLSLPPDAGQMPLKRGDGPSHMVSSTELEAPSRLPSVLTRLPTVQTDEQLSALGIPDQQRRRPPSAAFSDCYPVHYVLSIVFAYWPFLLTHGLTHIFRHALPEPYFHFSPHANPTKMACASWRSALPLLDKQFRQVHLARTF